jgi:alkanesulfonate monooxygenase SsuD/methylene tetrahydromethanopterin reductase-like flavin-dependent oxidoreductase (luciferase family)
MRVGVGLPSAISRTPGQLLPEWAERAELRGFASLGVLERVAYDSHDPFAALAAAAACTTSVGLVTMVAIGPLRPAAFLAKQAGSVHAISGGRLVLGLSIGARREDYEAIHAETRGRGARLSDQLLELRPIWEMGLGGPGGLARGPKVLSGGLSGQAFARMARWADGYVHGGGPPRAFAGAAGRVWAAWTDVGRPGQPELWGQGYFALGPGAEDAGAGYLRDYYAFTGPFAEKIAAANLTSPQAVKDFVRGYEEAGCDELVLLPTVADLEQLDRLAEVLA